MKKIPALLIIFSFLVFVPVPRADEGMWTFDNPPLKQWKEKYNFTRSYAARIKGCNNGDCFGTS